MKNFFFAGHAIARWRSGRCPDPARRIRAGTAQSRAEPPVPQSMPQVQLTFAPVVKRVAPAVVNVYAQAS
jgi:S1-C subfamily serine protease